MKRIPILNSILLTLAIGFSVNCYAGSDIHWSYAGDTGPEYWEGFSSDFAVCGSGTAQSPININTSLTEVTRLREIDVKYRSWALNVENNGHTMQVNMAPGSRISIGEKIITYFSSIFMPLVKIPLMVNMS